MKVSLHWRLRVPVELLGKSAEELRELLVSLGEPAYRGPQIYRALYAERRFDFAAMTNLPAALRARLAEEARITLPRIVRRFPSVDGSIRYLFSIGGEDAKAHADRGRLHAQGRPPDDLHFDAGGLRRGLPFLPDRAVGADPQPHGG